MAKKNSGGARPAKAARSDHKMGNILTAAKSTMAPANYEKGYPPFENMQLANQPSKFSAGKKKG
jgi:hypothetical protein